MQIILLLIMLIALFYACMVGLFVLVLQFIILNLTTKRMRFLRWLLLTLSALSLLLSAVRSEDYILAGLAITIFVGWALAWKVYRSVCGEDREENA